MTASKIVCLRFRKPQVRLFDHLVGALMKLGNSAAIVSDKSGIQRRFNG
jgi:hypothetical protein